MTVAPPPAGPYSPAVRAGDLLFCSGQLGTRDGNLVDGAAGQLSQAIANLAALLATYGADLHGVVKTTVFVTDLGRFAELNAAYAAAFGDHRPARSAIQVAGLPLGAEVEIEAVARLGTT